VFGHLVGGDTNVKACCQVPKDVKEDLKSVQLGRALSLKRKAESSQLDSSTRTGLSTTASTNRGAVYGDLKAMLVTPPGGDAADKAVAEWTYHYGVPFNAVDSVYFSRMCKAVMEAGPKYKPPCRKKLAGNLLVKASFFGAIDLYRSETHTLHLAGES
jgi:hypothetical protein